MVESSTLVMSESDRTINTSSLQKSDKWEFIPVNKKSLLQEFKQCSVHKDYSTIDLTCSGYGK